VEIIILYTYVPIKQKRALHLDETEYISIYFSYTYMLVCVYRSYQVMFNTQVYEGESDSE